MSTNEGPYRLDFHQPSKSHAAFVEDRMEWLFPATTPTALAASAVSLANSAHHSALSSLASEVRELVDAANYMLAFVALNGSDSTHTTNTMKDLRRALSAPGIKKLLKAEK